MPKIKTTGPLPLRLSSMAALNRIALTTYTRRLAGRRMAPDWDVNTEIGIRFWRHQFTRAMREADPARGRQILDALQTETDDIYALRETACDTPKGRWYDPVKRRTRAVVLYFHGGGYAFHGAMSARFAAMLAYRIGAPVFAPDYRLTPEHPHPAQAEDALAAWDYVTTKVPAQRVVVIGDSAGGHMALSLLTALRDHGLAQPALCIGLCPWTDIGDRGASLHENDPYDLVQGWMALQFGRWLDPEGRFGREALSPISHDYSGLAPLYLQTGGREILRDMTVDFAQAQANRGADVMLDLWADMPHDFHLYDSTQASSRAALERIRAAVWDVVEGGAPLPPCAETQVAAGRFAP